MPALNVIYQNPSSLSRAYNIDAFIDNDLCPGRRSFNSFNLSLLKSDLK